jgi:hypothetical protein
MTCSKAAALLLWLAFIASYCSAASLQEPAKPTPTPTEKVDLQSFISGDIAKIVKGRETLKAAVLRIKEKTKANDPNCLQDPCKTAREKYTKAYAAYSGWTSAVVLAIKADAKKAPNLRKSKDYQQTTSEAADLTSDFVNYVDNSKGFFAFAQSLFSLGIDVWSKLKKARRDQWAVFAEDFRNEAKWSTWEEIKLDK